MTGSSRHSRACGGSVVAVGCVEFGPSLAAAGGLGEAGSSEGPAAGGLIVASMGGVRLPVEGPVNGLFGAVAEPPPVQPNRATTRSRLSGASAAAGDGRWRDMPCSLAADVCR